jgi:hypothetical protein
MPGNRDLGKRLAVQSHFSGIPTYRPSDCAQHSKGNVAIDPSFLNIGLGAQVTMYGLPSLFKSVYGARSSAVIMLLHLRPAGNIGTHMQMTH